MSDAQWNLQLAVLSALDADVTLATFISDRIYDSVPDNPTFPYITIGEELSRDESTFGKDGFIHTVEIHSWSEYEGRKEVKQIMDSIHAVLHKSNLSVDANDNAGCMFEFGHAMRDPDGKTYHGVQRFRFITQPDAGIFTSDFTQDFA